MVVIKRMAAVVPFAATEVGMEECRHFSGCCLSVVVFLIFLFDVFV